MRKLTLTSATVVLALLFTASCAPRMLDKSVPPARWQMTYQKAVGDAALPQPWEVAALTPVTPDQPDLQWKLIDGEPHVRVVSWKSRIEYYQNDAQSGRYNTGNYPIWVTLAPQLQARCQSPQFGRKMGVNLRLQQLLGLPPTTQYTHFVVFWVRPVDLFRPCIDAEISDDRCQYGWTGNSVAADHTQWINDLRLASYYSATWTDNYPWTALGYTYDWHPRSRDHVGLSEYVIAQNAQVVVDGIYTTSEYCQVAE